MQYAKDNKTGRVIHVRQFDGGAEEGRYTCPLCRMRVQHVDAKKKRPHFAHWKGEGRPECELYTPTQAELDPQALKAAINETPTRPSAKTRAGAAPARTNPLYREPVADLFDVHDAEEEGSGAREGDESDVAGAAPVAGGSAAQISADDGSDPWDNEPGLYDARQPASNASNVPVAPAAPAESTAWFTPNIAPASSPAAPALPDPNLSVPPAEATATGSPVPPLGGWGNDPEWAQAYDDDDVYGGSSRKSARGLDDPRPDLPLGSADFLFKDLNPRQREAVEAIDGPVLVVAGAGSGKTRVITRRIAHMLVQGVPPWRITALTFTNKAAGEMRHRIEKLIQDQGWNVPAQEIWMSTFHSICARILRREAHHLGLQRSFSIYDEDDVDTLLKQLLDTSQTRIDYHEFRKPSTLRKIISEVKNGTKPLEGFEFHPSGRIFVSLFDAYNRALRANNACDFDDLLLLVVKLFNDHPAVREQYARRFRYVLIDEFQDTNPIQYDIVKALGSVHRNICATGDPDQSIYGWRGADIRNILNFEHDFPDTRQIVLDQNYRSTQLILDAASEVITRNKERKEKRLYSELGSGEEPLVLEVDDELAEAEAIADAIERRRSGGARQRDCAVFYRINAQSGPIEQALVQRGLPYVVVGGTAFYQRKEVKDALAYLRLAANPSDDISFQRVINFPRRKIGPGALAILEEFAKKKGVSLLTALRDPGAAGVLGGKFKVFAGFVELIDRIASTGAKHKTVRDAVTVAIHDTGLMKEYAQADDETFRTENLIELINAGERFDRTRDGHGTLVGFLENVALVSQVDRWDSESDHVTLMTIHMAKGLEFPFVWIAGIEDGLFPLIRQDEDPNDNRKIEEERRLMYVAITRAQRGVTLLHASSRMRYGNRQPARPSRFLDELPATGVRYEAAERGARFSSDDGWRVDRNKPLFAARFDPVQPAADSPAAAASEDRFGRTVEWEPDAGGLVNSMRANAARRAAAAGKPNPPDPDAAIPSDIDSGAPLTFEDLTAGLRVTHKQYSRGVIVSVDEVEKRHPKVIIRFDKYGEKEFSGRLVQLWRE
ncbi:MAG TPA: UvrD-helicase domain-containing protein [Planctomycetota bacterium]|nr:UvrD-helicase domain-containing protein [Planctomycetota bacterium]